MSDYSNYSVSDYDEASDEDNYAGAYGGYDDLYDDVIEAAGYDAWDIYDDEFDFDEERQMFEFDPFAEYFALAEENSNTIVMTYQTLGKLAEMTFSLLEAWNRRSELSVGEDQNSINSFQLALNLYQLEPKERDELRVYSVLKIGRLLGGSEEVLELKRKVGEIVNLVKNVMMRILSACLPCSLPYPVMSLVLSHLVSVEGAAKIGQVVVDDEIKVQEMKIMDELYHAMADVFDHLKVIMFNIEPNSLASEPSLLEKKSKLQEKFQLLENTVKSSHLGLRFEELEIEAAD